MIEVIPTDARVRLSEDIGWAARGSGDDGGGGDEEDVGIVSGRCLDDKDHSIIRTLRVCI